jgi:hypothetical protein
MLNSSRRYESGIFAVRSQSYPQAVTFEASICYDRRAAAVVSLVERWSNTMTTETETGLKFLQPFQTMWKSAFLEVPITVLSDSLRFAGARLQAQGDYFSSLLNCRSVPEIVETQSEFVRKSVDEYGAETSRIMEDLRANISKAA